MEHEVQLCSCLIRKVREERRTGGAPRVARARGASYTVVTRWLRGGYAVVTPGVPLGSRSRCAYDLGTICL
jgi:hypothetical protein